FDCATVQVPLDYAHPERKISILVDRLKASGTKQRYQGALLVNPGGPGASGLGFAAGLSFALPKEVLAGYDLIGFDPRGVGHSTPIHCVKAADFYQHPEPDWVPTTPAQEASLVARAK